MKQLHMSTQAVVLQVHLVDLELRVSTAPSASLSVYPASLARGIFTYWR